MKKTLRNAVLYKTADGRTWWLEGVASDDSVDRDGDRMSLAVLNSWASQINEEGVNMHGDHQHELFDTLGVFKEAEVRNGSLIVRARLEDPELNPKVEQLLAKIQAGVRVGLSIGGDLTQSHREGNSRVIDKATLYEISAVGIPANGNSMVFGAVYKSLTKGPSDNDTAPASAVLSDQWPQTIVFDWNGTVDARGTGRGIPLRTLLDLKALGKNVIVYTSSTKSDEKLFMRSVLDQNSIPYTDDESVLDSADVYIGDKHSDAQRSGKHGAKFIWADDFDPQKLLQKALRPEQLLELRNPMQPEAKIATQPGKSGSSEVFRTDTGWKPAGPQDDAWNYGAYSQTKPTDALIAQLTPQTREWLRQHDPELAAKIDLKSWNQLTLQKGDVYILNNGPSETDSLGEGPVDTTHRVYEASRHPEQDPIPIRPTRSPTGSPISRDTLKTEDEEDDEDFGSAGSGSMGPHFSEEKPVSMRPGGAQGYAEEQSPSAIGFSTMDEEGPSVGTDLRLAPKRTHIAR